MSRPLELMYPFTVLRGNEKGNGKGEGNAEEDLQNQIDAMEQYQADKLAGKKPCKGGETKRNENFVEQRVKKEDGSIEPESMGMCFLFDCGGTLF